MKTSNGDYDMSWDIVPYWSHINTEWIKINKHMEYNWQKINVDGKNKNIPDFNETVLLYQLSKDYKHFIVVGYLESVDINGLHWKVDNTNDLFDLHTIFGLRVKESFQPTHWCRIQFPEN